LSAVLEPKFHKSNINAFIENSLNWADQNDMQMNTTKTKEMILGPLSRSAIPEQSTEGGSTERVLSFKLLKFYVEYIALFRLLVITC